MPKSMILNVDFALKLRFYRSLKSFKCLKWIIKNLSTTLHTQFNYIAEPVCPFKTVLNLTSMKTLNDILNNFSKKETILKLELRAQG